MKVHVVCEVVERGVGPDVLVAVVDVADVRHEFLVHEKLVTSQASAPGSVLVEASTTGSGFFEAPRGVDAQLIEFPVESLSGRWRLWVPSPNVLDQAAPPLMRMGEWRRRLGASHEWRWMDEAGHVEKARSILAVTTAARAVLSATKREGPRATTTSSSASPFDGEFPAVRVGWRREFHPEGEFVHATARCGTLQGDGTARSVMASCSYALRELAVRVGAAPSPVCPRCCSSLIDHGKRLPGPVCQRCTNFESFLYRTTRAEKEQLLWELVPPEHRVQLPDGLRAFWTSEGAQVSLLEMTNAELEASLTLLRLPDFARVLMWSRVVALDIRRPGGAAPQVT